MTVLEMHVVLVHPEIAPNTGNIIRLCANTGAELHLVEPLGFSLDDRSLRRAGLDYHELATLTIHQNFEAAMSTLPGRKFAFTSSASTSYDSISFCPDDVLVFGAERAGLQPGELNQFPLENCLTIPMRPGNRSLNLANSVAVVVYEAWRQAGFADSAIGSGGLETADASKTPDKVNGIEHGLTSERLDGPAFDR